MRPTTSKFPSVLLCAALVAPLCSCEPEGPTGPRYVFLISLDTVAAEYCSVYGYEKPTTQFLEELASNGAVFERHVANSNNTLKSHASIMTGMLPGAHGARDDAKSGRRRLAPEFQTLAEQFQEAGFRTAGFATHANWLTKGFGIAQGFEHFESEWRPAKRNTRAFLRWFDAEQPERAFVFLHYFDAHSDSSEPGSEPYRASAAALKRFAGERPADFKISIVDPTGKELFGSEALRLLSNPWNVIPPDHLAYLRGTYDAGLAQLDLSLRALFEQLEERNILEDSLVVVTSDHGEEFKQHGGLLHHQFYDEVMHVPLIITLPGGRRPARARIDELTRSIDLAPTILELAGLRSLPLAQGRSFARVLLEGGQVPYADTIFEDSVLRARDEQGEYKFIPNASGNRFYDLDNDPAEQVEALDGIDPARIENARARLDELRAESELVRQAVRATDDEAPELSEEQIEELRSLGYLGDE